METTKMEKIYQMIANTVNKMIPDKWNKIYLYAEVLCDSRCVYFDFESTTKNMFIYSLNIPDEYGVDENRFQELKHELIGLFEELHEEFKINSPQAWNSLVMFLDNTGKFKMDYSYDEVKLTPHEQRIIWKYKMLGVYPTSASSKKIVDDYINAIENEQK